MGTNRHRLPAYTLFLLALSVRAAYAQVAGLRQLYDGTMLRGVAFFAAVATALHRR